MTSPLPPLKRWCWRLVVYGIGACLFLALPGRAAGGVALEWQDIFPDLAQYRTNFAACGIAVDHRGNVLVTGYIYGYSASVGDCFATIKYNSRGEIEWAKYYGYPAGDDKAVAVGVDELGNVYVTGSSAGSGTGLDIVIIKYQGADGRILWDQRYNNAAVNGDDVPVAMTVTPSAVYVTGTSVGSGTGKDYITIKYSLYGLHPWFQRYDGPDCRDDEAKALAVDAAGRVWVTGTSEGTTTGKDFATITYSPEGALLYVNRYDSGNGDDYAVAVAAHPDGDAVYVAGSTPPGLPIPAGYLTETRVIKYNASGGQVWQQRLTMDFLAGMALDGSGAIYLAGSSYTLVSGYDYYLAKLNAAGESIAVGHYRSPGDENDVPGALAVDKAGNAYLIGFTRILGLGTVVKFNPSAVFLWEALGPPYPKAMVAGERERVYITGGAEVPYCPPGGGICVYCIHFYTLAYRQSYLPPLELLLND